MLFSRSNGG
jgi:hypothetical protein